MDINKNEVVYGPITSATRGSDHFNGKMLISGNPSGKEYDETGPDNSDLGLWEVDVLKNDWKLLVTAKGLFDVVSIRPTDQGIRPIEQ